MAARDGNKKEGIWKKRKLQEGAGEMTAMEAAGSIHCAAVMASTLLPHLQLCRPHAEINSGSEEMQLTSIFKVKGNHVN